MAIVIINAAGVLILQTTWRRAGRSRTMTETVAGEASLSRRLAELVPLLCGAAPEPTASAA